MKQVASAHEVICEHILRPSQGYLEPGDGNSTGAALGGMLFMNRDQANHRWHCVHQMRPDEMFAFKLYDSEPARPQWTGHNAFNDPHSPPDAAPRMSMELRTVSFIEQ